MQYNIVGCGFQQPSCLAAFPFLGSGLYSAISLSLVIHAGVEYDNDDEVFPMIPHCNRWLRKFQGQLAACCENLRYRFGEMAKLLDEDRPKSDSG